MKFDWLQDLIAILDTGSVVEAAAARNISQSAFSRRIQATENILGLELIDRTSKPNRPSEAVRLHSRELRELAHLQTHTIKQLQAVGRTGAKLVVIAAQHAITTYLGADLVKRISAFERTHVRLKSGTSDDCELMLLSLQADFAITYRIGNKTDFKQSEQMEEVMVATETLIPIVKTTMVDDVLWRFHNGNLDIVAYPGDVFLGVAFNREILPNLEKKCDVNVVGEAALSPAVLELAAAGVGVAWVPMALALERIESGTVCDMSAHFGTVPMQIFATRLHLKGTSSEDPIWTMLTEYGRGLHGSYTTESKFQKQDNNFEYCLR